MMQRSVLQPVTFILPLYHRKKHFLSILYTHTYTSSFLMSPLPELAPQFIHPSQVYILSSVCKYLNYSKRNTKIKRRVLFIQEKMVPLLVAEYLKRE